MTPERMREEAAKVDERAMLPCDMGGDLCCDPYTSETIAADIRRLPVLPPSIASAGREPADTSFDAILEDPRVMALVCAMTGAIEAIDAAYDGPGDNGRYSTRERAALAPFIGATT